MNRLPCQLGLLEVGQPRLDAVYSALLEAISVQQVSLELTDFQLELLFILLESLNLCQHVFANPPIVLSCLQKLFYLLLLNADMVFKCDHLLLEATKLFHDNICILPILDILSCNRVHRLFLKLKLRIRLVQTQPEGLQSFQVELLASLVQFLLLRVEELLEDVIVLSPIQLFICGKHFVNYCESTLGICGFTSACRVVATPEAAERGPNLGQPCTILKCHAVPVVRHMLILEIQVHQGYLGSSGGPFRFQLLVLLLLHSYELNFEVLLFANEFFILRSQVFFV